MRRKITLRAPTTIDIKVKYKNMRIDNLKTFTGVYNNYFTYYANGKKEK